MSNFLDFEKPLVQIEEKIRHLNGLVVPSTKREREIKKLQKKQVALQGEIFSALTPWQILQIARHPQRPSTLDFIGMIFSSFTEMHGDRLFGDDQAIVAGLAILEGRSVAVIGHQKGKDVKDRIARNFGMPHPEGYRKALRMMQMAERFDMPVITFIDTPGAYPGVGAEQRGQSEAIARNLQEMSCLNVPILSVVIGEGGSGGALALSVADRILIMQYAVYSVISPEGCAAILWSNTSHAQDAANALKMTATDLTQMGIVDEVIPEPPGAAHRDPAQAAGAIRKTLVKHLNAVCALTPDVRLEQRYNRFRSIGRFTGG